MYPQFLIADFSSDVITGNAPLTVNFTNETVGWPDETAPIISHEWVFGDGNISSENNPSNIYAVPGTYSVTLTETRNFLSDTVTKTAYIVVADSMLNADFIGTPRVGSSFLTVFFTDRSSGPVENWYWEFGDGYTSIERNPVHFYRHPGDYTVSLTVYSNDLQDIETKDSYVKVGSEATYDIAPGLQKRAYRWGSGLVHKREVGVEIKRISQ